MRNFVLQGEQRFMEKEQYTIDDILALPEGERAELLDGRMFMMASPTGSLIRQKIIVLYDFEHEEAPRLYYFTEKIKARLLEGLTLDFAGLNMYLENMQIK